jgi:hypothetical protein
MIILCLASTGGIVYVLIISLAVPTAWYVMLIHMYYDLVANLVIIFSMSGSRRAGRKQNAEPKSPKLGFLRGATSSNPERTSKDLGGKTFQGTTTYDDRTSPRPFQSVTFNEATPNNDHQPGKDHFVIVFQSGAYDDADGHRDDTNDVDTPPTTSKIIPVASNNEEEGR